MDETITLPWVEIASYRYSKESLDLERRCTELSLLQRYIRNQEFLAENSLALGEHHFTESYFVTESSDFDALYEEAEQKSGGILGILKSILEKLFGWLIRAIKALFDIGNGEKSEKADRISRGMPTIQDARDFVDGFREYNRGMFDLGVAGAKGAYYGARIMGLAADTAWDIFDGLDEPKDPGAWHEAINIADKKVGSSGTTISSGNKAGNDNAATNTAGPTSETLNSDAGKIITHLYNSTMNAQSYWTVSEVLPASCKSALTNTKSIIDAISAGNINQAVTIMDTMKRESKLSKTYRISTADYKDINPIEELSKAIQTELAAAIEQFKNGNSNPMNDMSKCTEINNYLNQVLAEVSRAEQEIAEHRQAAVNATSDRTPATNTN